MRLPESAKADIGSHWAGPGPALDQLATSRQSQRVDPSPRAAHGSVSGGRSP